jgi:excinuclease ABC subunit C
LNPSDPEENPQDWMASFVNQYYEENMIPDEVLLPLDLGRDINTLLKSVLEERSSRKIKVAYAGTGDGQRLLELANKNASEHFKHHVTKTDRKREGLKLIQEKLGLKELPNRIECYDISNFQGAESVASQVVFEEGVPSRDNYRRYKIKTVEGANDFASMKEVLTRRLAHKEYDNPDLIVVDGGKGQLGIAVEVLKELERTEIPVVGLAKARSEKGPKKETEERIFIPGRQNPVLFPKNSEALHILTGIRDEAHRFAITYHRKLRENRSLESELDAVTGLGEKRKKIILNRFESIEQLKIAPAQEIADLPGFNFVLAERILLHLNESEVEAAAMDTAAAPKT